MRCVILYKAIAVPIVPKFWLIIKQNGFIQYLLGYIDHS